MEFLRFTRRLNYVFLPIYSNSVSYHHSVKHVHPNATVSSIKQGTVNKIEQLSLLSVDGDYGLSVLKAAIDFTEPLRITKVEEDVEPMYSPFENELIPLRNDCINNNASREDILKNAVVLEEEYFVAPLINTKAS
ncbi:glutamyl-tRNA(Gln) amidotransferase subunit C, mitochondrial [Ceratina calcarata]|uniref:Glutamyl-tRNA(Gln) amidotransferase subunit C, mitochondrial n=1 Tax=Ceratina calcarata TaxID=156304 RepID=A0AAJ7NCE3_9HYME|nr:glutamyl-tRNA(Gln) amidotransferase subunit C, mitochondrial [Ceratina calcarata]